MEYTKLGRSGLVVSRLIFGCMSLAAEWGLSEEQSREQIRAAVEAGVNIFDTADLYGRGKSETILGASLKEVAHRDDYIIASKVFMPMTPGPNRSGLNRKHIIASVEDSLKRLGTDYIDLYQIHRFDPSTPIEETLEALDAVVKAGKVRYIGASSTFAWQMMKMLGVSERRGLARFVSMQNHYNLLYREEEREMMPLCIEEGLGVIPWSPLARGRLARTEATVRSNSDRLSDLWYPEGPAQDAIVAAVRSIAVERGVAPAQIGLAWLLGRPGVTGPVIGVSKPHHLSDALAAIEIKLTQSEVERLETPYKPVAVAGINGPWR